MNGALKRGFLHCCRWVGLFSWSKRRTKDELLILCYHGFEISDESKFRPRLFMTPGLFRKRMDLLAKHNRSIVALPVALQKLSRGELEPNTIVITIDDGFYSTFRECYPILNSYKFPATLYVTTYYVKKRTPVFPLVVQYIFWKSKQHSVALDTSWSGGTVDVVLDDLAQINALIDKCVQYGEKNCTEEQRQKMLRELGRALSVDVDKIQEERSLSLVTVQEIGELSKNGFDIQLHTHRHDFPIDNCDRAKREIEDNRAVLQQATEGSLNHFCYPSGIWSPDQEPWLQEMAIESATTCEPGLNDRHSNPFALNRFLDSEEVSEIEFLAEISGFSESLRRLRQSFR